MADEIFPYPGSTRSLVWKYFGFRKRAEGPPSKNNLDMDSCICKLCKKSYVNKGNTTNLQFHLDKHHSHEIQGNQGKLEVPKDKEKRLKQTSITSINQLSHPKPRLSGERKRKLDDMTLKLIVGKVLPVNTTQNDHFIALTKELDPRYSPPTKHGIIKLLNNKHREMAKKLMEDLPCESGYMAFTHDGWTSCATDSYSTVTGHFITNDWLLRSVVLHTKHIIGSHTSENIADGLKETVSTWNLPIPTVVTDNAANEKKAVEILQWERCGCYGHRINLVVKNSLEVHEVNKILSKCRKLVGHFHKSTSLNDCLKEKQALVFSDDEKLIGHKLISDCPTRWNSSLDMLKRILEQTPAIMAVASDTKINRSMLDNVKYCSLTFEEQLVVEELIEILDPFHKATTILCAENYPTMNKVLVTFTKVSMILEKSTFCPVIKKVVMKMREQLCKRITAEEEIPLMAAMLSPDTKNLEFLSETDRLSAHNLLKEKAMALVDDNLNLIPKIKKEKNQTDGQSGLSSASVIPRLPALPDCLDNLMSQNNCTSKTIDLERECEVSSAKKMKCADLEEWFDDVFITNEDRQPKVAVIERELATYIGYVRGPEDGQLTLLQWWKKNECMFPRLSFLARKYLAVPASSVPSERVFSLCGNLVSKKRSRMNPDLVDSFIFLKMNMDLYW